MNILYVLSLSITCISGLLIIVAMLRKRYRPEAVGPYSPNTLKTQQDNVKNLKRWLKRHPDDAETWMHLSKRLLALATEPLYQEIAANHAIPWNTAAMLEEATAAARTALLQQNDSLERFVESNGKRLPYNSEEGKALYMEDDDAILSPIKSDMQLHLATCLASTVQHTPHSPVLLLDEIEQLITQAMNFEPNHTIFNKSAELLHDKAFAALSPESLPILERISKHIFTNACAHGSFIHAILTLVTHEAVAVTNLFNRPEAVYPAILACNRILFGVEHETSGTPDAAAKKGMLLHIFFQLCHTIPSQYRLSLLERVETLSNQPGVLQPPVQALCRASCAAHRLFIKQRTEILLQEADIVSVLSVCETTRSAPDFFQQQSGAFFLDWAYVQQLYARCTDISAEKKDRLLHALTLVGDADMYAGSPLAQHLEINIRHQLMPLLDDDEAQLILFYPLHLYLTQQNTDTPAILREKAELLDLYGRICQTDTQYALHVQTLLKAAKQREKEHPYAMGNNQEYLPPQWLQEHIETIPQSFT